MFKDSNAQANMRCARRNNGSTCVGSRDGGVASLLRQIDLPALTGWRGMTLTCCWKVDLTFFFYFYRSIVIYIGAFVFMLAKYFNLVNDYSIYFINKSCIGHISSFHNYSIRCS